MTFALVILPALAPLNLNGASIGLNFTQTGAGSGTGPTLLTTADSTGVIPQQNWNNIDDSTAGELIAYSQGGLVDDAGAPTMASITGGFNGSWGMQVSPSPTNNFLGNLALQGSSTVSNIPFVTYDVYVYMSSNANQSGGIGQVTIDGQTRFVTSFNNSSFIEGTATSAGASTSANFVRYRNLTASSFTVQDGSFQNRIMGITGVQIVQVPEPSTAALAGLSLLGLGLRRRRTA